MSEVAPVKSTSGGGYLFEDLVGAFLAASMLARKSVIGDLGPPERISFQVKVDGWALDDMLVSFHSRSKGTRRWAVSIRSRPQIERVADRDFVANAWEELLGRTTSGFDPDRDYVGLVVSSLDKDTRKDLEELRNLAKEQEPEELDGRIGHAKYVSTSRQKLWNSFRRPDGPDELPASPGYLLQRFKYLHLDLMDVDSLDRSRAVELCQEALASNAGGDQLWDSLLAETARTRTAGGFMDRDKLIERLGERYLFQTAGEGDLGPFEQLQGSTVAWVAGVLRAAGLGEEAAYELNEEHLASLPPRCRQRVEALAKRSPVVARHLVALLSETSSRTAGVLSRLAGDPPVWMVDTSPMGWEVLADFMTAHDIDGAGLMWERVIEAGSPRSSLYLIRLAMKAANDGETKQAKRWLSRVPPEYPLFPAAEAYVAGDPSRVRESVETAGLVTSEDCDLALRSLAMLIWAYSKLDEFHLLREVLRSANRRFSGRAWLLFHEANSAMGMVDQVGLESLGGRDLLRDAIKLAISSRDCFRLWDGPSYLAVDLATRALMALDDPERVVELASLEPEGQATTLEANHPNVRRGLFWAHLMLGRYGDLNAFSFEGVDPFDRAFMRGILAVNVGDETASSRIKRAMALADSEASQLKALMGLAMLGEADDDLLAEFPKRDAALVRGMAALNRDDIPTAINYLQAYWLESSLHAHCLALAQRQAGDLGAAADTLTSAAERFGVVSLYDHAVEVLVEQGNLQQARALATEALARDPSVTEMHRVKGRLIDIAHGLEEWQMMESYARSVARAFPQDQRAAWMVVYALYRQVRNQEAWDYLVEKDLSPDNKEMARLATEVCQAASAPGEAAERLLRIADMHSHSEEVVGHILGALRTGGDSIPLTEDQLIHQDEIESDFLSRYPQSAIFGSLSFAGPEEIAEMMRESLRAEAHGIHPLIREIRYGSLPYGALLWHGVNLPYSTVLMSVAADWLTAIPTDEARRERERQIAQQAIGGSVAVDTSVVALTMKSDLDPRRVGQVFKAVLVADELIVDARKGIIHARESSSTRVGYDPALDRLTHTEIDETQRQANIANAQAALEVLSAWQSVNSASLPSPAPLGENERRLRPWDASIRLAASRKGCTLWCDDIALRLMAEAVGIPTFGTWALYEALSPTPEGMWLPSSGEMKMRLLSRHIADVPISLSELGELVRETDSTEEPDLAVATFLFRPHAWSTNPSETFVWYLKRIEAIAEGLHRKEITNLMHAACCGWGTAVPDSAKTAAIGRVLGATVHTVRNPDLTPILLAVSRHATKALDPGDERDPLPDGIKSMLTTFEEMQISEDGAAQALVWLFSKVDPDDFGTVISILDADR